MQLLHLDTETYCATPIKNGTHRYAEAAEIIMWQWAVDDETVQVSEYMTPALADLLDRAKRGEFKVVCHNSAFDRTVMRHNGYALPVERWHDTMVQALCHGLPGGLAALCGILGVPTDKAKDRRGKQLINLFCKPRPKSQRLRRATKETHPAEWAEFLAYGRLDIVAMREVYRRLPTWNYQGPELALWRLDQRINDRGVCVDLDLVRAAIDATGREQARLADETKRRTGGMVEAATQRDKLMNYVLMEYGIGLQDVKTSTVERMLEAGDLPRELVELLTIRLSASKTSAAKYARVRDGVSSDGRLRGLLQFAGAARTGRWAGRLFQPQNLPRPSLKQKAIEAGIADMKAGVADLIVPDVMELATSAIRGAIVAARGKRLVVADLSNIEGRVLAWLAGEAWKLQAFRDFDTQQDAAGVWVDGDEFRRWMLYSDGQGLALALDAKGKPIRKGHDLYKLAYAKSFGVAPEAVDDDARQVGKVQELALGYQGGVGAFLTFALAYGIDLEAMARDALATIPAATREAAAKLYEFMREKGRTQGLSPAAFVVCDSFKRLWRDAHPAVVALWDGLETIARLAINNPGRVYRYRTLAARVDGAWLRIRLPSGRYLCYSAPEIHDGQITYMGVNQYTRQWARLKTYGGKLTENVCQAVARDVLAANMPAIDERMPIVLTVHDEIITEADDRPELNAGLLAAMMATPPEWAQDMPLAAAGFVTNRYQKG